MAAPAAPLPPTGPAPGAPFPDFTLPDQHGDPLNFTAARDGMRAMLVVYRSAAW
jgi:peroxiredoxin